MQLKDFLRAWRDKANAFRPYFPASAKLIDDLTAGLEECLRQHELEALTLDQAVEESGYSRDHLSRLIADGKIPNAGKKGAPRMHRCDMPRKPKARRILENGEPDLAGEVLEARGLSNG